MNQHSYLVKNLQRIAENNLTKDYIIPLLQQLGFHNVEFYGGPDEYGRDILFWEMDKFGKLKLHVAQVKHFKLNNKASSSEGFQTIINQLTNCFQRRVPYADKSFHFPSEVYLISSYPIDSKTVSSRFSSDHNLSDKKISILDGGSLATLLMQHIPEIIKDLLDAKIEIQQKIVETLNNKTLLTAIGYRKNKDLNSFYTDINFSLGKNSTKLFVHSDFVPSRKLIQISNIDWAPFKNSWNLICKEYYADDMFIKQIAYLDDSFLLHQEKIDSWNRQIANQESALMSTSDELSNLQKQKKLLSEEYIGHVGQSKESIQLRSDRMVVDREIEVVKRKLISAENEIRVLGASAPELLLELDIDGQLFVPQVKEKRVWVENSITRINSGKLPTEDLNSLLIKCKSIIEASDLLLNQFLYYGVLRPAEDKVVWRINMENTRFTLPINHIFNCGLNLTILGEAGAGKTTTLQMYANKMINDTDKWVFWLPLSRVVHDLPDMSNHTVIDQTTFFEKAIFNYLVSIGTQITFREFTRVFFAEKVVLLLDGIDEVIKLFPHLPEVVVYMSEKYSRNLQILLSSRISGDYLRRIPFFSISMLPFTVDQRNKFIRKWFETENDQRTVSKIFEHLGKYPAISEIVNSPLLATTLCVLAKYDIPLPQTEINLYDDRIRLLSGYYDSVKNISSRISLTPKVMETVAQKLAFHLHKTNKRELSREQFYEVARTLVNYQLNAEQCKLAVDELIDPCNILVPVSEDGSFGFGHLRYQEHLAARELKENRAVNVISLMDQPWWKAVLILFASMSSDITWLINALAENSQIRKYEKILIEMIHNRPFAERHILHDLVEKLEIFERSYDVD